MKVVALWSGGKDSCLALHRALYQGKVTCLATLVPADGREFLADPRLPTAKQAQAMGLAHLRLPVAVQYRESYEQRLGLLREESEAEAIISRDIDVVDCHTNWVAERCLASGLQAIRPLWKNPRIELMDDLLGRKIWARIKRISNPGIPSAWRGRIIDRCLLNELKKIADVENVDLCGENGEYHTMVIRAPAFGGRTIEE